VVAISKCPPYVGVNISQVNANRNLAFAAQDAAQRKKLCSTNCFSLSCLSARQFVASWLLNVCDMRDGTQMCNAVIRPNGVACPVTWCATQYFASFKLPMRDSSCRRIAVGWEWSWLVRITCAFQQLPAAYRAAPTRDLVEGGVEGVKSVECVTALRS
jgi:hypothetical protein